MIAPLLALALAASPGVVALGPTPPARPRRIGTLAPSLTELVLALGGRDRLVGVSRFDDDPAVAALPKLGGYVDPAAEAIVASKLDLLLVTASPGNEALFERLGKLGVPVLELSMRTIAEVEQAERAVGEALGEKARGEALAQQLEQKLTEMHTRASPKPPAVLMVFGWDPLVVAGPGSFPDELLRAAGGANAAAGARGGFVNYSVEAAAASHAALILDLSAGEAMPRAFTELPGLKGVPVVKPRSLALLHPGPQLVQGLDDLTFALQSAAR